jgi:diguanylate cyclase (GGDEF)-like protein
MSTQLASRTPGTGVAKLPPVPKGGNLREFRGLGLRGKIVSFAIALVAVPLLMSSIWMITSTRDELKSSVNDSLLSTTDGVSSQIHLAVKPLLLTVSLLRETIGNSALGIDEKSALLHASIEELPGLLALRLSIPGKPLVYLFNQQFKERLDEAGLTAGEALREPQVTPGDNASFRLGSPFRLSPLEVWLLPVSVRLEESPSIRAMVLSAYLDLGELQRTLASHPFWRSGGIWLLDDQGNPILQDAARPLPPGLAEFAAATSVAGSERIVVTPFVRDGGTSALTAVATIDHPPWTILVATSAELAYATVTRMQRHLAILLGLGLTAAILGALALAYRIGRPIREMAVITEQVGQGNFKVRVREDRREDEIAALGSRLNVMISGLAESHQRLDYMAHHDALTGLPNRLAVLGYLAQRVGETAPRDSRVALLFLDLDRFKTVNDSLGHSVGDQLLRMAAERLSRCLKDTDMAARLGGDEFLVVVTDAAERKDVADVASRIIKAFGVPFHLRDYELYVGVTIGISLAPDDGSEIGELIDFSDMAMYEAKEHGRGQFRFFRDNLKSKAVRHLTLDNRLRHALERDELEVYYQPIVRADSGEVFGMEALIRWPKQEGGFVAFPGEFIPLAEDTGLVVHLDEWVMYTACEQTLNWHRAGLPKLAVSVNVSARQFSRPSFLTRVRECIEKTGLNPASVRIEVTERLLMDDTDYAIELMSAIKELGIKLCVDDFGTGYSSLAYLRRFPLDYLKVAQEFVRGMGKNPNDALIAAAVIGLAKSLGLEVIAEGVETSDELAFLRRRDCELIQGYVFSRPLPARDFENLLRAGGKFRVPSLPVEPGHA